jgi:hypothetical protein
MQALANISEGLLPLLRASSWPLDIAWEFWIKQFSGMALPRSLLTGSWRRFHEGGVMAGRKFRYNVHIINAEER